MKLLTPLSIRRKLLLLVSAAVLPALGVILYTGIDNRNEKILSAKRDLVLLTQSIAAQQEQIVIGIRQTLMTLSLFSGVKNLDAESCNKLLSAIHKQNPVYSSIGAASKDGNIFAASTPFVPGSINIADHELFRDTVREQDFVAGEYGTGRVSGIPAIAFAYPVFDDGRRLRAVLVVGFKFDSYQRFITEVDLPEGSVFSIADQKGVTLYRYPQDERISTGTPNPFLPIQDLRPESTEAFSERQGRDGVYRIYAHKWLWLSGNESPYLSISVGIPKSLITRKADIELLRNLVLLFFALLLSLIAASFFGGAIIVRPIKSLADKTLQIGRGQANVRTQLAYKQDELGQLARSFDDMAVSLDHADNQRKVAEDQREALIVELQEALAKIKSLKGLLPICSSCKKIRTDKGSWEQIEVYIRDRSEADFSHSICPECAERLYPEHKLHDKGEK